MTWLGPALLVLTVALPLALAALALMPALRGLLMRTLPVAPLPGLAAALFASRDEPVALPDVLLGVGLAVSATDAVFLGFVSLLWSAAGAYALAYLGAGAKAKSFAGFWLLTLAGNLGIFVALDVIAFYISFSFLSLAAFGLVIHDGTPAAHRAGRVYIVLAVFGEICLLLALMIGAAEAGSVLIADAVAGIAASDARALAVALLVLGFGLKAGLVPLHVWLPLAHPAAPTPASAVLSGAIVKAGIYGLMRFVPAGGALPEWGAALMTAGHVTAYFGVAVGVTQRNPKTVLAYSTLSQMGLVVTVLGAGLVQPDDSGALAAATLYAAHHGLAKGALFLAVGVIAACGAGARRLVLVPTAILALAIAGLPLTGGALAKLAIKGPLGEGLVALLATLSAVGTTLIMLRFLVVSWRVPSGDGMPPLGLVTPWAVTVLAAVAVPWMLFPELSGQVAAYALTPASLWEASWPILLGSVLALAGARLWRRLPAVPEGDLVVVGEAALRTLARRGARWRMPALDLSVSGRPGSALLELAARADASLRRFSIAGPVILAVAVAFGLLL